MKKKKKKPKKVVWEKNYKCPHCKKKIADLTARIEINWR